MGNIENTAVNDLIARASGRPRATPSAGLPVPALATEPPHLALPVTMPVAAPFEPRPPLPTSYPMAARGHGAPSAGQPATGPAWTPAFDAAGAAQPGWPAAAGTAWPQPLDPRRLYELSQIDHRDRERLVPTFRMRRRKPGKSDVRVVVGRLVFPVALLVSVGLVIGAYVAFGADHRGALPDALGEPGGAARSAAISQAAAVAPSPAAAPTAAPPAELAAHEIGASPAPDVALAAAAPVEAAAAPVERVTAAAEAARAPAEVPVAPAGTEAARAPAEVPVAPAGTAAVQAPAEATAAPAPAAEAAAPAPAAGAVVPAPTPRPMRVATVPVLVDVRIDSTPRGAEVTLVDRGRTQLVGNTPIDTALDPSREYDLVFTVADQPPHVEHLDPRTTRRVSVALGRPASAPRPADSAPRHERAGGEPSTGQKARPHAGSAGEGTLMVSSKPPCAIVIDGRPTGLTTPQRSIALAAGNHRVTLVNSEKSIKKTVAVQIAANTTEKLIADLMK